MKSLALILSSYAFGFPLYCRGLAIIHWRWFLFVFQHSPKRSFPMIRAHIFFSYLSVVFLLGYC